jgi:hypothetical protein
MKIDLKKGCIVALIYCFFNGEVTSLFKKSILKFFFDKELQNELSISRNNSFALKSLNPNHHGRAKKNNRNERSSFLNMESTNQLSNQNLISNSVNINNLAKYDEQSED